MRMTTWAGGSLRTSRIIYGCMEIGGSRDGAPIDDATRERAFAAIDAAREAGITAWDHADIYCRGASERVFGEYLAANPGWRASIVIQSKCGILLPEGDRPVMYDHSRDWIVASAESIVERLRCDYLDVLLLHRPDPLADGREIASAMAELRERGLVRAFGVSNHSAAQIEWLRRETGVPIVANQLQISLGHADAILAGTVVNQRVPDHALRDYGTVEYMRREGIAVQAWSPLARGAYSGRPASDGRAAAATALVAELAERHGVAPEAIVVAWLLRHPAPIFPVIGSTNPERIRAAAQADGVSLSREEWYRLTRAARGIEMP